MKWWRWWWWWWRGGGGEGYDGSFVVVMMGRSWWVWWVGMVGEVGAQRTSDRGLAATSGCNLHVVCCGCHLKEHDRYRGGVQVRVKVGVKTMVR